MLSKLLSPTGSAGPAQSSSHSHSASHTQPPSTPPSNGHLLSPTSNTNNNNSSNKRKSPYMDTSPRKSRSPQKVPTTPDHTTPAAPPSAAASPYTATNSRPASLGNLLNAEDQPVRRSNAPSIEADDRSAVDADVSMHEEDDERGAGPAEEADQPGEAEDDGEDVDDDDDDDEDDEDDDDDDEDDDDEDDIVALDGPTEILIKAEPADPAAPTDADASAPAVADGADGNEVVNQLQPKKKKTKRARQESMDEDLPPPPPPLPTIRIHVDYKGGDETLDFNFIERAAQAGYAVANAFGEDYMPAIDEPPTAVETANENTPAPPGAGAGAGAGGPMSLQDMMNADPTQLEELARKYEEQYDEKPTKKQKKRRVIDYDLNDPFIDDSDLKIDMPTHIARPKKEGFFVHSGLLELMEESPHRSKSRSKPKIKKEVKEPRKSLSEALRLRAELRHHGSRDSPILVDSDNENDVPASAYADKRSPSPENDPVDAMPVDRVIYRNASREAKYLPPFDEFPDELGHRLRVLRRASVAHKWDPTNKGKFPEHLKPYLSRAGEAAFHHDLFCVVDKDPADGTYDRYHEKAFVTSLCSVLPYNRLTLGKLVLKLCYHSYWRWLRVREEEGLRQWKELLEPEIPAMIEGYEQDVAKAAAAPEEEITEEGEGGTKKSSNEVKKMPVFTQDMKDIFRQLVENTQEQVDINKRMEDWNQRIEGQSSELNMRKFLYTRIINMYPEGYMTSLALSRAFTNFKRSGMGAAKAKEEAAAASQQQQ